ncbi:MAG: hypothetical protein IK136_04280 [Oscillospiraceae bacterium]|nr:hypothetical protein [Oscillospiraceae bacterium]
MKRIVTNGIGYLERLTGSSEWYWGSDYTSGDLYEARELFELGRDIRRNRLVLVHFPDGRVVVPVEARDSQYFGRPVFFNGLVALLLVDFPAGLVRLLGYDDGRGDIVTVAELPLDEAGDCYNLMPAVSPLSIVQQTSDHRFRILWPDRADFPLEPSESFDRRDGDRLVFSRWYEDPDYRETVVIRDLRGQVLDSFPGTTLDMPDGQRWLLV